MLVFNAFYAVHNLVFIKVSKMMHWKQLAEATWLIHIELNILFLFHLGNLTFLLSNFIEPWRQHRNNNVENKEEIGHPFDLSISIWLIGFFFFITQVISFICK